MTTSKPATAAYDRHKKRAASAKRLQSAEGRDIGEMPPVADLAGRVVAVHDGDTITIRTTDDQTVKVRLAGIDVPAGR